MIDQFHTQKIHILLIICFESKSDLLAFKGKNFMEKKIEKHIKSKYKKLDVLTCVVLRCVTSYAYIV